MEKENKKVESTKEVAPVISDKLLEEIRQLRELVTEQGNTIAKQNEKIAAVADKSRLEAFDNKGKKKEPNRFRVSTVGDKLIVGWKTIRDFVMPDPITRKPQEMQEYEVQLLGPNGETSLEKVVGYHNFSEMRYSNQLIGEEIGRSINSDGLITLKLKLQDGRTIEIDATFIN